MTRHLDSIADDLVRHAREHGDEPGLCRRRGADWESVTWGELYADVVGIAKGLVVNGVRAGDCVGLWLATSYEWTVIDYAIWFAGGIGVPLYPTSSSETVQWVLADSGARVLVSDLDTGPLGLDPRIHLVSVGGGLDALVRSGSSVSDAEIEERRTSRGGDQVATVLYTSGTTGRPKGCALSHANFISEADAAISTLPELFDDPAASTLLFLPLAHVFARIVQVGCVRARVRLGYCPDVAMLVDDLATFRPTFAFTVPRVLERLFAIASQRAASEGRARAFDAGVRVAVAVSRAGGPRAAGLGLRARHRMNERVVYQRVRDLLGGRLSYIVCGGAPLGDRLAHFFHGIGISVLEGYGLTETTGAVTVATPATMRIGSVGRALPGTALRIAEDGELLVRGDQVFAGYWGDVEASAAVLTNGWLRTGDLAEVDDDGLVHITGRRQEILVTTGGKAVAPVVLEDRVGAHPLVAQCLVVGDGRPYLAALVTLDVTALARWASEHRRGGSAATLAADPEVRAEIARAVEYANAAVSQAEAIREFTVLADEWSETTGELTPTQKLRRSVVTQRHHGEIEALYP